MADDTDNDEEDDSEMRAINEMLVIAAVRQQELAEAASESAQSALKSGELYRLLAENFPNGMVLLFDQDLRHVLADGRGLVTLGLSREALEGRTVGESFAPQTCRQIEPAYRAALAGVSTVLDVQFFAEGTSEEGGERIYQVHTLPVMDDQGNIPTGMVVAQDVTERRQAEQAIRWQAYHDALTCLPNRALLRDRLEQVLAMSERSGEIAALLFLDLDGFKHVNDTLGHAAGDRLLQSIAVRLTGCLRAQDTVARQGGDEFVVLLPGLRAAEDTAEVAEKIRAALAVPVLIDDQWMFITASVGISVFPFDGLDAASLMESADTAMYRTKRDHLASPR